MDDETPLGATPAILCPSGQPARKGTDTNCPRCQATKARRVLSAGFGEPHDVCGHCGYEFQERTL